MFYGIITKISNLLIFKRNFIGGKILRTFLGIIAAGLVFLATAFMLYNPAPPAGKTADFVSESSQTSVVDPEVPAEESDNSEQSQSVRTIELTEDEEQVESELQAMAIFRPAAEKMFVLTKTTPLPYTEDELVYWNNLALEHGLPPYDGTGDFYTFTQAVKQAIDQASIAQEPVYEEPVYEEPPVYYPPVQEPEPTPDPEPTPEPEPKPEEPETDTPEE